jgi:Pentapeptide repeats (9 copies)
MFLNRIWSLFPLFLIGLSVGMPNNGVVPASDVLAKINAGQSAEFDYCTIVGDLDLSGLRIGMPVHFNHTIFKNSVSFNSTTFDNNAHFWHSVFKDTADFRFSTFNDTADFRSSDFNGTANFRSSDFNDAVYFADSVFEDNVDFGYSDFEGDTHFGFSLFNGDAGFGDSKFNGITDFSNSRFNGDAEFSDAEFNDDAYFSLAVFKDTANFWSSAFNDLAHFRSSTFNGLANFGASEFSGSSFRSSAFNGFANFGASEFKDNADFGYSAFNGDIDFGYSVFNDIVDFPFSVFNGTANFNADIFNKGADFNDVVFRGYTSFNSSQFKGDALFEDAIFQNTLSLTRVRYGYLVNLYMRWHNINHLEYDDAAYLSLLKNFKTLGYNDDYDQCYYQYRKEHRAQPWPGISDAEEFGRKFVDYFLQYLYGYGTRPRNALIFSVFTVMIFGIFWKVLGLGGPHDVTKSALKPDQEWLNDDIIAILIFSATVFLSGMRLFVDPPALPRIEGRSRSTIKSAFVLERVLGMMFFVLFFIAWSAIIVRQLK